MRRVRRGSLRRFPRVQVWRQKLVDDPLRLLLADGLMGDEPALVDDCGGSMSDHVEGDVCADLSGGWTAREGVADDLAAWFGEVLLDAGA